jgi:hypothetical protein
MELSALRALARERRGPANYEVWDRPMLVAFLNNPPPAEPQGVTIIGNGPPLFTAEQAAEFVVPRAPSGPVQTDEPAPPPQPRNKPSSIDWEHDADWPRYREPLHPLTTLLMVVAMGLLVLMLVGLWGLVLLGLRTVAGWFA